MHEAAQESRAATEGPKTHTNFLHCWLLSFAVADCSWLQGRASRLSTGHRSSEGISVFVTRRMVQSAAWYNGRTHLS